MGCADVQTVCGRSRASFVVADTYRHFISVGVTEDQIFARIRAPELLNSRPSVIKRVCSFYPERISFADVKYIVGCKHSCMLTIPEQKYCPVLYRLCCTFLGQNCFRSFGPRPRRPQNSSPVRFLHIPGYSHRNTLAERTVQITNTKTNAATSPACADHRSPFQIPSSSETA